jgi:hypothetical protein
MAFNFNWSPLTADAEFYERARDLLTAALNKSPKPPIIVDDILVTEFNLGSVPPELEILEIGDLAEDRFRGIFKMCYSGDAFLTLRTRVQVRGRFFPCCGFAHMVFPMAIQPSGHPDSVFDINPRPLLRPLKVALILSDMVVIYQDRAISPDHFGTGFNFQGF